MRQLKPKPLFESSTVRGATASAIATIVIGILPFAQNIANRHCAENKVCESDVSDVVEIISFVVTTIGLGSAGFTVVGRASIGDLWTPKGVPGPNREDFSKRAPSVTNDFEEHIDSDNPSLDTSEPEFTERQELSFRDKLTPHAPEEDFSNGQRHSFKHETTFDDPMEGIK